jgi:hypothetical protein
MRSKGLLTRNVISSIAFMFLWRGYTSIAPIVLGQQQQQQQVTYSFTTQWGGTDHLTNQVL